MRLSLLFLLLSSTLFAQTQTGSLDFDGETRNYRLYLPDGYDPAGEPMPLVFNLHGFTSNALEQQVYADMDAVADTAGFIVCYPNGLANQWNVGWAFNLPTDDVGYIDTLISTLAMEHNVDLNRVYSCGMSNGGFMSYRLACELSDRIVAVASVTGSIAPGNPFACNQERTTPVLQIHGTDDPTVPYNGAFGVAIPMEDVIDFWTNKNGCTTMPDTIAVPDLDPDDQSTAERIEWNNCNEDTEMVFYKIFNGGHTWPGSPINVGVTNQDFHASAEIWNFFNRYQLEETISSTREVDPFPVDIFPNPTADVLQLRGLKESQTLRLVDARGQQRLVQNLVPGQTVDLSSLTNGLYFLHLTDKTGRTVKRRVVVQR